MNLGTFGMRYVNGLPIQVGGTKIDRRLCVETEDRTGRAAAINCAKSRGSGTCYSYRKASTGLRRAAFHAGYTPKKIPIIPATETPRPTSTNETAAGNEGNTSRTTRTMAERSEERPVGKHSRS